MDAQAIEENFDMMLAGFFEIRVEESKGYYRSVEYSGWRGRIFELGTLYFCDFLASGAAEDNPNIRFCRWIWDEIHNNIHLRPNQWKKPGIDMLPHANDGCFACCIHECIIAQENPID